MQCGSAKADLQASDKMEHRCVLGQIRYRYMQIHDRYIGDTYQIHVVNYAREGYMLYTWSIHDRYMVDTCEGTDTGQIHADT